MPRVCARPGCAQPATATFLFAPTQLAAWIGDLDDDPRSLGNDLCATHVERVSVPKGWTLTDGRTTRPALAEVEPASPMLARAFRSARAS